jgi:hypothetical protein
MIFSTFMAHLCTSELYHPTQTATKEDLPERNKNGEYQF